VINGRGELVGLNFDRVWENIAGDFGYNPARSRNVVVDLRYLLWLLDRAEDAGDLLAELGVSQYRGAAARPAVPKDTVPGDRSVAKAGAPEDCRERSACGCSGGEAAGWGALVFMALPLLGRRRRA
jgi:MYXO-CTERM domain-containing protein